MASGVSAVALATLGQRALAVCLAALGFLAPCGVLAARDGGAPAQHLLQPELPGRGSWQPPGLEGLQKSMRRWSYGHVVDLLREHGLMVYCGIGFFLLACCLGCGFIMCRRQTLPDAEAGDSTAAPAGAKAGATGPGAAEDDSPSSKLSSLKKEKTKVLLEQAMQRQKLEKLMEAIMVLEAELSQEAAPSPEEVQGRAEDALRAAELYAERSILSALAYAAPLAVHGNRVYEVLERRRQAAQERAAKVAYEEAAQLCTDLQGAFNMEEDMRASLFQTLSSIEVPSLATLMASAFAPAQLRVLLVTNQLSVSLNMIFAIISSCVLLMDHRLTCGRTDSAKQLQMWYVIDLAVSGACLLIRFRVMHVVNRILEHIQEAPKTMEDPVMAFRVLLDFYLTTGADALAKYDEIKRSCLYALANWALVFNSLWMLYATDIVFNTSWKTCHTAGLVFLRVRVVLFQILLVPIVVHLVLFFVSRYFDSDSFRMAVISAADSADRVLGIGLPVLSILAQSILVQNRHDLVHLQLRRYELKKLDLQMQQREAEETLQKVAKSQGEVDAEIQRLEQTQNAEAAMTDSQLRDAQCQARNAILNDAEEVFRRLSQKAQDMSKQAEEQLRRWEQEGGPGIMEAIRQSPGLAEVQDLVGQARARTEGHLRELANDERLRLALTQGQEAAQSMAVLAEAGASKLATTQDLPAVGDALEQSRSALSLAAASLRVSATEQPPDIPCVEPAVPLPEPGLTAPPAAEPKLAAHAIAAPAAAAPLPASPSAAMHGAPSGTAG